MLRDDFETKIRKMREFNREECARADQRLNNLENAIEKEISDRVTQTDERVAQT
jgi:hypothetical protein